MVLALHESGTMSLLLKNLVERPVMLYYALIFLVIALIAGFFGFFGVAGLAASIAKVLFVVFVVLLIISLIMGRRRPPV